MKTMSKSADAPLAPPRYAWQQKEQLFGNIFQIAALLFELEFIPF